MASDCQYCSEIAGRPDNNAFLDLLGEAFARTAVIARTGAACVMPSVGALVPGHVLVIPRRHHLNLASMPDDELAELCDLALATYRAVGAVYRVPVVAFEHGTTDARKSSGGCLDHAHLHVLPLAPPLLPTVRGWPGTWTPAPDGRVLDVASAPPGPTTGYLILWDGRQWWVRFGAAEPQELRRSIAEALGEPDRWDWAVFPNPDLMQKTVADLTGSIGPVRPGPARAGRLDFTTAGP